MFIVSIQIPKNTNWKLINASLHTKVTGKHLLVAVSKEGSDASIDWI
jgi:hypothetical protein